MLSILPVFATVIVFIGLGSLYNSKSDDNRLFFIVLGLIPVIFGIIAVFVMKDSPSVVKNANPDYLKETLYGFRKDVIKENNSRQCPSEDSNPSNTFVSA